MAVYDVSTTEKKASPSLVAGGTLYADNPLGTILPFGGAAIPTGWLLCDGTAVSRTTYSELFAVIGTAFGSGDGSTTFNLPDMRESVPKGAGLTGHTVGAHLDADGLAVGEFLDDRIQNITLQVTNGSGGMGDRLALGGGTILNTPLVTASTGFRYGATTEVKSVGVNYIIKAQQVALPIDLEQGVADSFNFQSGVTANQSMSAGGNASVSITLTNPMPDDEYTVDVKVSNAWNIATISNQTENGFTIMIQNTDKSASSPTTVSWQAFRIPH